MYHVIYATPFLGQSYLATPGRTDAADAQLERDNLVAAGHSEVIVVIDLETADANLEIAAASSRRLPILGKAGYGNWGVHGQETSVTG
jgi:hypothetical protein